MNVGDVYTDGKKSAVVLGVSVDKCAICLINHIDLHRSNVELSWQDELNAGLKDNSFVTCQPFLIDRDRLGVFSGSFTKTTISVLYQTALREAKFCMEYAKHF